MELEDVPVLVFGASAFQAPLAEYLLQRGASVHVASPEGEYPLVRDARMRWHDVDVTDLDALEGILRDHHVDLLFTDQTDLPVPIIWELNRKLGLPGMQRGDITPFFRKDVCRSLCARLGLPVPAHRVVNRTEVGEVEFPWERFVVKPVDSQGSRGVVFLSQGAPSLVEDLQAAIDFSKAGKAIAEEFIEGTEYPVEGVICGGRYQTLAIGDRTDFQEAPGIPNQAIYREFAPQDGLHAELDRVIRMFSEATGVQRGITHAEVLVDAHGKCFIVEIALRSGASFIGSHLVPWVAGLDVHGTLLAFAQGRDELVWQVPHVSYRTGSFHYFYLSSDSAVDPDFEWPAVPEAVAKVFLPPRPNSIGPPRWKNNRYGPFILLHEHGVIDPALLFDGFVDPQQRVKFVWH